MNVTTNKYKVVRCVWGMDYSEYDTGRSYESLDDATIDCHVTMAEPCFRDSLVSFEVREILDSDS